MMELEYTKQISNVHSALLKEKTHYYRYNHLNSNFVFLHKYRMMFKELIAGAVN